MGKKTFEIVLGSYEEYVIGFKYENKSEELTQTFADHGHTGSVRSVAHAKNLIASGGADDRIVVYDFKTRTEHRTLMYHDGTVNCLQFTPACTHLISGSEDGVIAMVRVGNWMLEKVHDKAHNGAAVLDIAVHPTSKMMLSLGADRTLRTWNLVKGRLAYTINLNSKCKDVKNLHSVKWAPDGIRFVLVGGKYTDIWSTDTGGIVVSIEHKSRVTSCIWNCEVLIVGYEDGDMAEVTVEGEITIHKSHDCRVKCLSQFGSRIVSASSSGEIKVWNRKFKELSSTKAGCRFTSMCVLPSLIKEIKEEEETVEILEDATEDEEVQIETNIVKTKKLKKENGIKSEIDKKRKRKLEKITSTLDSDIKEENLAKDISMTKSKKKKSTKMPIVTNETSVVPLDNGSTLEQVVQKKKIKKSTNSIIHPDKNGSIKVNQKKLKRRTETTFNVTPNNKKKKKLNSTL